MLFVLINDPYVGGALTLKRCYSQHRCCVIETMGTEAINLNLWRVDEVLLLDKTLEWINAVQCNYEHWKLYLKKHKLQLQNTYKSWNYCWSGILLSWLMYVISRACIWCFCWSQHPSLQYNAGVPWPHFCHKTAMASHGVLGCAGQHFSHKKW